MSKTDETNTGMKPRAEWNYHNMYFARRCPAQHRKITYRYQTTNNHVVQAYGYLYAWEYYVLLTRIALKEKKNPNTPFLNNFCLYVENN